MATTRKAPPVTRTGGSQATIAAPKPARISIASDAAELHERKTIALAAALKADPTGTSTNARAAAASMNLAAMAMQLARISEQLQDMCR